MDFEKVSKIKGKLCKIKGISWKTVKTLFLVI